MSFSVFQKSEGFLVGSAAAQVSLLPRRSRFVLRANAELKAFKKVLGFQLPDQIGHRGEKGEIQALCVGPDEWIINAEEGAYLAEKCAMIYEKNPHSLVDVSAREIRLKIEGTKALDLLATGCPRDCDGIEIGKGCRSVFDGASVILWREGQNHFTMDVWNSFADHTLQLLEAACRELVFEL